MVLDWSSFLVESGKRKFFFTFRQVPHLNDLNFMMTVQLTVPTAKQVGARFLQTPCNHNMYTFCDVHYFQLEQCWHDSYAPIIVKQAAGGGGGGLWGDRDLIRRFWPG